MKLLEKLVKEIDKSGAPEDFELVDEGLEAAVDWFEGDEEAAAEFDVFAGTEGGGLFAFWLYGGRPRGTAPIAYLGAEGRAQVVANDLEGLLSLLAVIDDELEFVFSEGHWPDPGESSPELEEFCNWLEGCGIRPCEDVEEAVTQASRNHPSLATWVERWRTRHHGGDVVDEDDDEL